MLGLVVKGSVLPTTEPFTNPRKWSPHVPRVRERPLLDNTPIHWMDVLTLGVGMKKVLLLFGVLALMALPSGPVRAGEDEEEVLIRAKFPVDFMVQVELVRGLSFIGLVG